MKKLKTLTRHVRNTSKKYIRYNQQQLISRTNRWTRVLMCIHTNAYTHIHIYIYNVIYICIYICVCIVHRHKERERDQIDSEIVYIIASTILSLSITYACAYIIYLINYIRSEKMCYIYMRRIKCIHSHTYASYVYSVI